MQRDLDFLEPNLSFEVMAGGSGDDVTLRAWFELELRPSWVPADEVPARAVSLVAFAERVLDAEGHAERSGTADEDVGLQTHEIEVA